MLKPHSQLNISTRFYLALVLSISGPPREIKRDEDISWTMTSRGHFFSKWATSHGHCQRVTSRGHFLVTSRGRFCPREVFFLGEFSWTFFG